jgi:hypothetical protein
MFIVSARAKNQRHAKTILFLNFAPEKHSAHAQ